MKIVALTGGSGSGKSTVLNGLLDHFSDKASYNAGFFDNNNSDRKTGLD